jgi:hypothetical protein
MENLELFAVHTIVSECAESILLNSQNTRTESMRTWRRRKETLGVHVLVIRQDTQN